MGQLLSEALHGLRKHTSKQEQPTPSPETRELPASPGRLPVPGPETAWKLLLGRRLRTAIATAVSSLRPGAQAALPGSSAQQPGGLGLRA